MSKITVNLKDLSDKDSYILINKIADKLKLRTHTVSNKFGSMSFSGDALKVENALLSVFNNNSNYTIERDDITSQSPDIIFNVVEHS